MPESTHRLRITVSIEGEEGVREKEYTDHTEFLSDLRKWRQLAEGRGLRFVERTEAVLTLGDPKGPLFSGGD